MEEAEEEMPAPWAEALRDFIIGQRGVECKKGADVRAVRLAVEVRLEDFLINNAFPGFSCFCFDFVIEGEERPAVVPCYGLNRVTEHLIAVPLREHGVVLFFLTHAANSLRSFSSV